MNTALEFSEAQLCELWELHTSLEDDPRDVNNDLSLAFDDGELRQEMRVAGGDDSSVSVAPDGVFQRVRSGTEAAWSSWARIA